jgi:hypothetical protein
MQQQQTIIPSAPVHIKVAYENEFRRFLLTPVSFENLETTLKTLFNLNTEFRIKFQDDENDWVLLTTDQELVYATELSGSPLRLQVSVNPSAQPAENARGRGKGCRGRGQGRGGFKSPEERLTAKSSRLADRIAELEEKINSGKLTADRERVIRWRLLMLQDKLAAVKNRKESFANVPSTEAEAVAAPEPVSAENVKVEEEKPSCRGGRRGRGCGRGGWRRAMMDEDGTDRPVRERPVRERKPRVAIPPEIIENFRQCKADLRAARESGDAEKIQSCSEALKTARAAKFEARAALRAQASVDEQKL